MRKTLTTFALATSMLATPAVARDGAWYVGGELGAMIVEDIDLDIGALENAIVLNHDYGYDAALFTGYDLGGFRIEAEVAYKRARVDEIESLIPIFGGASPGGILPPGDFTSAGGSTSALSFMINGMLDFGDDEGLSGFVGGGVGMARVKFNTLRTFGDGEPFLDDSDTGIAWQVFAGVRRAISENIDVTVKYRFFNVPNVVTNQDLDTESRFRSHSLMAGIIFNFGESTPPPEPPPAPPPPPPPLPPSPPPPPPAVTPGPFIVFFDWDKDDITPQAAAILDNAAAAYQATGAAEIVLAGNADKSGSPQYNVGLSQRRADNVKSHLAGRGVPEGKMITQANGEDQPLVETADGVREPQNRNVQIRFGPGSGQ